MTIPDHLLDISQLDATAALLKVGAIAAQRTDESLQCELTVAGVTYATVFIVPAEGIFQKGLTGPAFSDHFAAIQERVLGQAFYATPRKNLYLLVVGDADFLARPAVLRGAAIIEQDLNYGKKEVLTPAQVVEWLRNPFYQLAGLMRANPVPSVVTVAERGQPAPLSASYPFNVENVLQESEEARHLTRQLAGALYRRIMGGDYKVFWEERCPSLGRVTDTEGQHVELCSTGERIVFAYALFLARAMLDITPGLCLGIHGSFDRLDTVRQIGAFDCLRDFVAATGANVLVQSAKSSLRELLLRRVRPVIEACGGTAADGGALPDASKGKP